MWIQGKLFNFHEIFQYESPFLVQSSSTLKEEKAQRRKSTSSLMAASTTDQNFDIPDPNPMANLNDQCEIPSKEKDEKVILKPTIMEKVAQRKKNWDYFEIDHPKAISGNDPPPHPVPFLHQIINTDI